MPFQPAVPPLLTGHLSPPRPAGSLTLVTSVLGASANWILLRHIQATLNQEPSGSSEPAVHAEVILISWLRSADFWQDGARKLGIKFERDARITYFDALQAGLGLQGGVAEVEEILSASIGGAQATNAEVLLVLDGIDFLLAATETTVEELLDTVGELREHVRSTIVSISADYPLVQSQQTPLEINHAALILGLAHQARAIWTVRELDTGSAADVSGVLRITWGPALEVEEEGKGTDEEEEKKEVLYFIVGDGAVKVFERGSS